MSQADQKPSKDGKASARKPIPTVGLFGRRVAAANQIGVLWDRRAGESAA